MNTTSKFLILILLGLAILVTPHGVMSEELALDEMTSKQIDKPVHRSAADLSTGFSWTPEHIRKALQNPVYQSLDPVKSAENFGKGYQSPDTQNPSEPRWSAPFCPDCEDGVDTIEDYSQSRSIDPLGLFEQNARTCPASPFDYNEDPDNYAYPQRVVGVLLFQAGSDLGFCSASLIHSNVIITAGHCVSTGGRWYDSFLFIPGYNKDAVDPMPFGQVAVRSAHTTSGWYYLNYMPHDFAFAVLETNMGDYLGYLGLMTDAPDVSRWDQYGYPAEGQFAGDTLVKNLSNLGYRDYSFGFSPVLAVGSPMTQGASGGPWIHNGHVNGLNSFLLTDCPDTVHSPYFDSMTWRIYQEVLNLDD